MLRRIIYGVLREFRRQYSRSAARRNSASAIVFPRAARRCSTSHFPPKDESVELLNNFRSPAQHAADLRGIFLLPAGTGAAPPQAIARRPRHRHARARRESSRGREAHLALQAHRRAEARAGGNRRRSRNAVPMHRLLEGDVGSGKTIVAFEAATIVIENGYQVALMAPTEILAVQHYLSARRIFAPAGYGVELIVSGRKRAEQRRRPRARRKRRSAIRRRHARADRRSRAFAKLGLVIVDEQHRFGVLQRKRLIEKGVSPHVLVMTATPIPRTLALTLYGDLDISVIDEMPPGRTPIETRWTAETQLAGVWEFVRREIAAGRQAYVVYPGDRRIEAGTESRHGRIRAPRERRFPEPARRPAARPAEKRGKRCSDGAISAATRFRFSSPPR